MWLALYVRYSIPSRSNFKKTNNFPLDNTNVCIHKPIHFFESYFWKHQLKNVTVAELWNETTTYFNLGLIKMHIPIRKHLYFSKFHHNLTKVLIFKEAYLSAFFCQKFKLKNDERHASSWKCSFSQTKL